MADLMVTAANVVRAADAKTQVALYGATVTAGQTVYADPADSGKFKPADADSATAAVRTTRGIALNSGANNQPAAVQTEGRISIGARSRRARSMCSRIRQAASCRRRIWSRVTSSPCSASASPPARSI